MSNKLNDETSSQVFDFFFVAPLGLEELLVNEIHFWISRMQIVCDQPVIQRRKGGVDVQTTLPLAMTLQAYCKIPTRILQRLFIQESVTDFDQFKTHISSIKKTLIPLSPCQRAKFIFSQSRLNFRSEKPMRILLSSELGIPLESDDEYDLYFDFYKDRLTVSRNISGRALYHRGWRKETGQAPIRENLASAMIWWSIQKLGAPFLSEFTWVDPFAGSGTILIEALLLNKPSLRYQKTQLLKLLEPSTYLRSAIGLECDASQFKVLLMNTGKYKEWIQTHLIRAQEFRSEQKLFVITNLPYGNRVEASKDDGDGLTVLQSFIKNNQVQAACVLRSQKQRKPHFQGLSHLSSLSFSNGGIPVVVDIWGNDFA